MENIKASYETMFIVETTKGEEAVAAVVAKFKALIEKHGEDEMLPERSLTPSGGQESCWS